MTKEMAQAMLVAQRYTEARMTAEQAKSAANNLIHSCFDLSEEEKDKIYEFRSFCERLESKLSTYNAKQYVEGLNNG
jgi:hypothetical protein